MKMSVFTLVNILSVAICVVVFLVYRFAKASKAPKEIVQRRCVIALLLSFSAAFGILAHILYYSPQIFEVEPTPLPAASEPEPTESQSEPTESQPEEIPLVDYAEILRNSEQYDGQEVRVAGRIARLGYDSNKYSFYFRDRLGFLSIGKDFEIRLSREFAHFARNEGVSDYYVKNQYVLVQGVWSHSNHFPALHNAKVIATGKEAQQIDQVFMDEWEALGHSYSKFPITDYTSLGEAPKSYLGQRVRTVGQVLVVGDNKVAWDKYFSFRGQANKAHITFSLQGCPPKMQNECVEGEYLVISCLVTEDEWGSVWFSDCFVECVGDEAESIYKQFYAE